MDKYKHTDPLVLQSAELTERTPFCPQDQAIAEYFDGQVLEAERQKLERHLADCRYCQARIGMLHRQHNDPQATPASEDAIATAKSLARTPSSQRIRWAPAWAMAAVVLLGVLFIAVKEPVKAPAIAPETRQLRNIDRPVSGLEVILPGRDQVLSMGSPIRWTEFPEGSHYTVFVLSDAGDVLWTEHLQDNEWAVQNEMKLDPNGDFFFRVEAELPNGETITSKHLAFRVMER
ncbi:MAG: zf-HC2 domain-containing protein [Xanthomonadales bacterium]|jgi:hypothetical protein|nr:zf-HC2 domain-containing protein [Xanthomonadales bacterium]